MFCFFVYPVLHVYDMVAVIVFENSFFIHFEDLSVYSSGHSIFTFSIGFADIFFVSSIVLVPFLIFSTFVSTFVSSSLSLFISSHSDHSDQSLYDAFISFLIILFR